jgi:uncharacterized protein YecE (DUF72 family)
VGTGGFGLAKDAFAQVFSCVEIQDTFYQPPQIKTLERWHKEVPAHLEFTLKAWQLITHDARSPTQLSATLKQVRHCWQLITHDARSPTYRRLKRTLSETEKQDAGYFRSTSLVNEAWETTLA